VATTKWKCLGKLTANMLRNSLKKHEWRDGIAYRQNTAYKHIEDIVATHFTVISGKESTNDALQWVHKAISNLNWELIT